MKKIIQLSILSLLCAGLFTFCKKDDEPQASMYYTYYPLRVGDYWVYDADSALYKIKGAPSFDVAFQIKDVVASTFTDDAGELAYRLERYRRADASEDWALTDVFTAKRLNREAQKVENNARYVKLSFPVEMGRYWDAEKYNANDGDKERTSKYIEVHRPYSLNGMNFDSTLTVELENNEDFIVKRHDKEMYAAGVGLISKMKDSLNVQPANDPSNPNLKDTFGYIYRQVLVEHGR